MIERKLPHEQKGLLLQDKDKLGYSILFSACAYTPELMPVYLDWLEKLEPAIQFSILQQTQTYLVKSTSSPHQTYSISISILYMIIMSNPQLLGPLLNVFKKLDVIFRRQLLVFVEPASKRNLIHEAMKLDRQQLTSFLQAIKEVDSRLLIQLLLQYDIKSLPPIVSLLENKELIDIVLKELEPMSEAERKLLFSDCTKEKPSFINILFRNSPEHFEKWLYPYLTHLKVDPSTLLPQPQYPFQSLLILVSHASMIANLPLYYRAMLNCYSQNHTQEYSLYNLSSFSALIFQASLGNNTLNHHIDYILKNLNDFSKKPALKLLKELVYLHIEKIPHEYKKFLESLRHQEELLQNLLSDEDQKGLNLIQNILLFKELELPNLETVLETYHEQNLLYASLLKTNSRNLTVLKHTMLHRQSFLDTLLKAISSFSTQQQLTLMTGANNILLFSVINVPSGLKTLLSLEPTIHEQCLKEKSLWETAFQDQHNFKTLVACLDKLEDANKTSVLASLESLDSNIYKSITDLLDSPIEPEAKKACSFKP